MRIIFLCILGFIGIVGNAQQLGNTAWMSIKAELKDGSQAEYGQPQVLPNFIFRGDSVFINSPSKFLLRGLPYKREENILIVGDSTRYTIEFLDDTIMILKNTMLRDSLLLYEGSRNYLINEKFYYDYLIENNLVKLNEIDEVISSWYLFPVIYTNISTQVEDILYEVAVGSVISGSMKLIEPGIIKCIQIDSVLNLLLPGDTSIVLEALSKISGNFYMPGIHGKVLNMPFIYAKIDFTEKKKLSDILLFTHVYPPPTHFSTKRFEVKNYWNAVEYFNQGTRLLKHGKYEKAIEKYNLCIENNANILDAWYNKAMALYKLNRLEEACSIWSELIGMGEKEALALSRKYCKE
jgi:hypothetical protein